MGSARRQPGCGLEFQNTRTLYGDAVKVSLYPISCGKRRRILRLLSSKLRFSLYFLIIKYTKRTISKYSTFEIITPACLPALINARYLSTALFSNVLEEAKDQRAEE